MSLLDIFAADGFTTASMITPIDRVQTVPGQIGSLGIFVSTPVRDITVHIEERAGEIQLIPTSQRGAEPTTKDKEKRTVRSLEIPRIAVMDRINASELQFLRAFGEEQQQVEAAAEINKRWSGPNGLMSDIEMTWEHMRLGALRTQLLDADGSTVLYDYATEFGVASPTFNPNSALTGGQFRSSIENNVTRYMRRTAKGANISAGVVALCAEGAWDKLMQNAEIRETFLNYEAAAQLRENTVGSSFNFAGVQFQEYFGTDDNNTVALTGDDIVFFPAGQSGAFEVCWAPGEGFDDVGSLGRPTYPFLTRDEKRNRYVDVEIYSYPLYICRRPDLVIRGTMS
ncbi:MAG: major capsid protein [Pseudomonadota bacterium]